MPFFGERSPPKRHDIFEVVSSCLGKGNWDKLGCERNKIQLLSLNHPQLVDNVLISENLKGKKSWAEFRQLGLILTNKDTAVNLKTKVHNK